MFRITEWRWEQTDDEVTIQLDVTKARERCTSGGENENDAGFSQDHVKATMREKEIEIKCYDRDNMCELAFGLSQLPGIDPEKSSFALTSGNVAASEEPGSDESFQRCGPSHTSCDASLPCPSRSQKNRSPKRKCMPLSRSDPFIAVAELSLHW